DLTIFVKQQKDLFRKFTETHLQRGYTLETMKRLVEQSGLIFVEALDADTHG
ncbi:MAG TPA: SAM-dependent methyltransferase, partial [Lachnospiraceae bacterium]|nr:SAM-dependent methyltransferase [Lachnospiraceae bacterium]